MSKLFIGLTGGIGSGKSTVAKLFKNKGIVVIDADQIARDVVAPGSIGLNAIIEKFGQQILNGDGQLNRAALREQIFNDARDRQWLNELLHPMIRQTMLSQAQQAQSKYVIFEVPLLFEKGFSKLTQVNIMVDCDEQLQIQRTSQRDNNSAEKIKKIIASQMPRQQKLELADDVIYNNQDLQYLEQQVMQLHTKYMQLSEAKD